MKFVLLVLFFFAINMALRAQYPEISDKKLADLTSAVRQICGHPSSRGKYWEVRVAGEGRALVKLIGLNAEAVFSKGEWEGIRDVLRLQDQASDRDSARKCAMQLTPIFIEKFYGNGR